MVENQRKMSRASLAAAVAAVLAVCAVCMLVMPSRRTILVDRFPQVSPCFALIVH